MAPLILASAALGVAGLGLWILNRANGPSTGPTAANVTTATVSPTTGAQQVTTVSASTGQPLTMWSYWNGLTSAQQQQYRQALWNWIAAGNWGSGEESASQMGITSVDSLSDATNLSMATDAYQTAHNGIGTAEGQIDATVFNAVVSGS